MARLPGSFKLVILMAALAGASLIAHGAVQVHRATHPPRVVAAAVDFDAVDTRVEEVTFAASDGVQLRGWYLAGDGRPAIVLCHDRGSGKESLLNLMLRLHQAGFTTLAFDFRGHGASGGDATTLGLHEKRDVLGAIAFLDRREASHGRRRGIYGVGMGAHAAVLAGADRPGLGVLVLDGLYPDAGYPLGRLAFGGWRGGERYLGFVHRSVFSVMTGISIHDARAADALPALVGRDLLLVSPAGDSALALEIQRMYERFPQRRDTEGNLVTLAATATGGLYGEGLDRYRERIAVFFDQRLR